MYVELPRDIETAYQLGLSLDEMGQNRYVSYMVSVHFLITRFERDISNRALIDFLDILNQNSNYLWFKIPYKRGTRALPFDFEFVPELPPSAARQVYDALAEDASLLKPAHQEILEQLKAYVFREASFKQERMMLFEDVRRITAKIRKALKHLTNFGGDLTALEELTQEFSLPMRKRFTLIFLREVLAHNDHPAFEQARMQLQHSYFQGSREAFEQNLSWLFDTINKVDEDIARRAALLREKSAGRLHKLTALASEDTQDYGALLERYWRGVQRMPFAKVRKLYDASAYSNRIRHLTATSRRKNHDTARQCLELIVDLQHKLQEILDVNSPLNISLGNETKLGIRAQEDRRQETNWLLDNARRLYMEILPLFSQVGVIYSELDTQKLPSGLQEAIGLLFKHQSKSQAERTRLADDAINDMLPHQERQAYEEIVEYDDHQPDQKLKELLQLHKQLTTKVDDLPLFNLSKVACILAAADKGTHLLSQYQRMLKISEQVQQLQSLVETEIEAAYLAVPEVEGADFRTLKSHLRHSCLQIVLKNRLLAFRRLNFDGFDGVFYQTRHDLIQTQPNLDERLVQLNLLLGELEGLPTPQAVESLLAGWRQEFDINYTKNLETVIAETREYTDEMVITIRKSMREIMEQGGFAEPEVHLNAFGLHSFCGQRLTREWQAISQQVPRVVSIKTGHQVTRRLDRLRDTLLMAQGMFRPERDGLENIERLLVPITVPENLKQVLVDDLTENYQILLDLKAKVDEEYYQLRKALKGMGQGGDIEHLRLKLNINDVEQIITNYRLKKDLSQDDLLRFATVYQTRVQTYHKLMEALKKDKPSEDFTNWQEVCAAFKAAYRNTQDATLRVAVLHNCPTFREIETQFLALFLNLAAPLKLRETKVYSNFMALLELAERPDPLLHRWMRSFWGSLRTKLHDYQPFTQVHNFQFNRDVFLRDAKKIDFSALSHVV